MGKSSSGRSRAESEVSSRSERRRTYEDDETPSRTRSQVDPVTPSSSQRKRSSRQDERDRERDDEYTPTSSRRSVSSRDPYASSNSVSNYATAPVESANSRDSAAELAYMELKRERRRESGRSTGQTERTRAMDDEADDSRRRSSSYKESSYKERDSEETRRRDSKKYSTSSSKTVRESSRALDNHDASLPQNQFPGQAPDTFTQPYRPPGLAADYYGDQGESVSSQPGVRPQPPTVIHTADQYHLYTPSVEAAPPPEPSTLGQPGAASSYFAVDASGTNSASQVTPSRPSRPSKQPSQSVSASRTSPAPSGRIPGSNVPLGAIGAVAAGAGVGAAAEYFAGGNTHSFSQTQQHAISSSGYQNSGQYSGGHSQNGYGSSSRPTQNDSNRPHYGGAAAAGLVGAAAAGYYVHNQHGSQQNQPGYNQGPNTNFVLGQNQSAFPNTYHQQQQKLKHKHRGPLTKLADWFRDPNGVAQFEEYTEVIGVCKYCFDPNSSPLQAPRKHHYHKHPPAGPSRYGSTNRVDKIYRNSSSSSDEGKRKRSSKAKIAAGAVAGYGAAKVGEAIYKQKYDFDDTYSVKSGQPIPPNYAGSSTQVYHNDNTDYVSGRDSRQTISGRISPKQDVGLQRHDSGASRKTRRSEDEYGVTKRSSRRRGSSSSRTGISRGAAMSIAAGAGLAGVAAERRRSRSRSGSRDRTSGVRRKKSYYSKRISPRHSYVDLSAQNTGPLGFGGFFSSPSANKKKGKKSKGLFNFGNDSTSSSDADLAFGQAVLRSKSSRKGKQQRENGGVFGDSAAILSLAATGAALAAESDRRTDKRKSRRDTTDEYTTTASRRMSAAKMDGHNYETMSNHDDEGVWEDAPEDDTSSVDTALAYGGRLSAKTSRESLADRGTSKWAWRWNKNKDKKTGAQNRQSEPQYRPQDQSSYNVSSAALIAPIAVSAERIMMSDPSPTASTPLPPMQYIDPMPTESPHYYDARPGQSVVDDGASPHTISSRSPIPLQQPQANIVPTIAAMPQVLNQLEADTEFTSSPDEMPVVTAPSRARDGSQERVRPRKRDSSPPLINPSMASRQSVSWDLTAEQIENERKAAEKAERRRSRREEKGRRRSSELKDVEPEVVVESKPEPRRESVDKRAARQAEIDSELQALYAEHERQMKEQKELEEYRRSQGETGGIAAAIIGTGVGAAAVAMVDEKRKKTSESDSDRRPRRKSSLKKSSIDRAESPSKTRSPPKAPSPPRIQSPPHQTQQERIARMAAQRVNTPSPVHENYGDFFVPAELAEHVREHNAASEQRREHPANVLTISPDDFDELSPHPIFEPQLYEPYNPHTKHEPDYHPRGVPMLGLIEATPPGSRSASRLRESSPLRTEAQPAKEEEVVESSDHGADTSSKVNWGRNSTHVFEAQTSEEERKDPVMTTDESSTSRNIDDTSRSVKKTSDQPPIEETRKVYTIEDDEVIPSSGNRTSQRDETPPDVAEDDLWPTASKKSKKDKKKKRRSIVDDDGFSPRSSSSSMKTESQRGNPMEEIAVDPQENSGPGKKREYFSSTPAEETIHEAEAPKYKESRAHDQQFGPVTPETIDHLGNKSFYQSPFAETVSDVGELGDFSHRDIPKTGHGHVESLSESPNEQRKSAPISDDYRAPETTRYDEPVFDDVPMEKPRSTRSERRRLERAMSSSENTTPMIKTPEPEHGSIPEHVETQAVSQERSDLSHPSMPGDFGVFDYLVDEEGNKMSDEANRQLEAAAASVLSQKSSAGSPAYKTVIPAIDGSVPKPSPEAFEEPMHKPTRANTFGDASTERHQSTSKPEYASDPEDWERSSSKKTKAEKKEVAKSDVGTGVKGAIAGAATIAAISIFGANDHDEPKTVSEPDFYAQDNGSSRAVTAEPDFYATPKEKKKKKSKRESEIFDDYDGKSVISLPATQDEDRKSKRRSKRDSEIFDDEDSKSVTSTPATKDEDRKSRQKSKRDSDVFKDDDNAKSTADDGDEKRSKRKSKRESEAYDDDDTRSMTSTSTEKRRSKEKEREKEKKSTGLFASLFSSHKSDVSTSSKKSSKSVKSESRADRERGDDDDREKRKKRKSKSGDNYDDSMSIVSEPPRYSRERTGSQDDESKKPAAEESRDTSVDDGFVSADEGGRNGHRSHTDDKEESFLARGLEMPTPMATNMPMGTDGVSGLTTERETSFDPIFEKKSVEATEVEPAPEQLPPLPAQDEDEETTLSSQEDIAPLANVTPVTERTRRWSAVRSGEFGSSPAVLPSPTAVPIHFGRRYPGTPGSGTRGPAPAAPTSPLSTPRTRMQRPKSTDGKEFKPLYLVERHGTTKAIIPEAEEDLPSLPSSRTSSANPSMEDLRGQALAQLEGQDYYTSLSSSPDLHRERGRPHSESYDEYLDSRSATPVPGERQRARESEVDIRERKEKQLKYEFHSPSELLRDPHTSQDVEPENFEDTGSGSPLPSVVSTDIDQEFMSAESRAATPEQKREATLEHRASRPQSSDRDRSRRNSAILAGLGIAGVGAAAAIAANEYLTGRKDNGITSDPVPNAVRDINDAAAPMSLMPEPAPVAMMDEPGTIESGEQAAEDEDMLFQPTPGKKSKKDKKKKRKATESSDTIQPAESDMSIARDFNEPDAVLPLLEQPATGESKDQHEPSTGPIYETRNTVRDQDSKKQASSSVEESMSSALELSTDIASRSTKDDTLAVSQLSNQSVESQVDEETWALPTKKSKKDKKKKGKGTNSDDLPNLDIAAARDAPMPQDEEQPATAVPAPEEVRDPVHSDLDPRGAAAAIAAGSLLADMSDPLSRSVSAAAQIEPHAIDRYENRPDETTLIDQRLSRAPFSSRARSESFVPTIAQINEPGNGLSAFEEAFERAVKARGLPNGVTREDVLEIFMPKRDNAPYIPKLGLTPVPEGTPASVASPPVERTTGRELDPGFDPSAKSGKKSKKDKKKSKKRDTLVEDDILNEKVQDGGSLADKNPFGDDFDIDTEETSLSREVVAPLSLTEEKVSETSPYRDDFETKSENATASEKFVQPVSDVPPQVLELTSQETVPQEDVEEYSWAPTLKKDKKQKKKGKSIVLAYEPSEPTTSQEEVPQDAFEPVLELPSSSQAELDVSALGEHQRSVSESMVSESESRGTRDRDLPSNEDVATPVEPTQPADDDDWPPTTKKDKKKKKKSQVSTPVAESEAVVDTVEEEAEAVPDTNIHDAPREASTLVEDDWAQSSSKKDKKFKKDKKHKSTTDWTGDMLAPAAVVAGGLAAGTAMASMLHNDDGKKSDVFEEPADIAVTDNLKEHPVTADESIEEMTVSKDEAPYERSIEVDTPVEDDFAAASGKKGKKDKKEKKSKSLAFDEWEQEAPSENQVNDVETIPTLSETKTADFENVDRSITKDNISESVQEGPFESARDPHAGASNESEPVPAPVEAVDEWAMPTPSKKSKKEKKKKSRSMASSLEDFSAQMPESEISRGQDINVEADKDVALVSSDKSQETGSMMPTQDEALQETPRDLFKEPNITGPEVDNQEQEWTGLTRKASKKDKKKKRQSAADLATGEMEKTESAVESREVKNGVFASTEATEQAQENVADEKSLQPLLDSAEPSEPVDMFEEANQAFEDNREIQAPNVPLPDEQPSVTRDATVGPSEKQAEKDTASRELPKVGPPQRPSPFARDISLQEAIKMSMGQNAIAMAKSVAKSTPKKKKTVGASSGWEPWVPAKPGPAAATEAQEPTATEHVSETSREIESAQEPLQTIEAEGISVDPAVEKPLAEVPPVQTEETVNTRAREAAVDGALTIGAKNETPADGGQFEVVEADEDMWASTTSSKKSKKDKKKRKSNVFDFSEPATSMESEQSRELGLIEDPVSSVSVSAMGEHPNASDLPSSERGVFASAPVEEPVLTEPAENDLWGVPKRTSKKDKKNKRQSGVLIPATEADYVAGPSEETESEVVSAVENDPKVAAGVDRDLHVADSTASASKMDRIYQAEIDREAQALQAEHDRQMQEQNELEEYRRSQGGLVETPATEIVQKPISTAADDSVREIDDDTEWAVTRKTSKKDKKSKKKSGFSTPSEDAAPVIEPEIPGEWPSTPRAVEDVSENATPVEKVSEAKSAVDTSQEQMAQAPTIEYSAEKFAQEVPEELTQSGESQLVESVVAPYEELNEDDEWAITHKPLKKDKKKKKSILFTPAEDSTPPRSQEYDDYKNFGETHTGTKHSYSPTDERTIDPFEDAKDIQTPAVVVVETGEPKEDDEWASSAKPSKKDKKNKKKSGVSTPLEESDTNREISAAHEQAVDTLQGSRQVGRTTEDIFDDAETEQAGSYTVEPTDANDENEWAASKKSSKKDKKKKKKSGTFATFEESESAMISSTEPEAVVEPRSFDDQDAESTKALHAADESIEEAGDSTREVSSSMPVDKPVTQEDDEWDMPKKSSKKDKKKRKSLLATLDDTPEVEPLVSDRAQSNLETHRSEAPFTNSSKQSLQADDEVLTQGEDYTSIKDQGLTPPQEDDAWSVPFKLSKKDKKKKGKSGAVASTEDFGEVEAEAEVPDQSPTAFDALTYEMPLVESTTETNRDLEASNEPAPETSSFSKEDELVAVMPDEPSQAQVQEEDEWAVPSRSSKKDKKSKKKKGAPSSLDEPEFEITQSVKPAEDNLSEASRQLSQKMGDPLVETGEVADNGAPSSRKNQEAVQPEEDEWTMPVKASKKDKKKKRKSDISTPAEEKSLDFIDTEADTSQQSWVEDRMSAPDEDVEGSRSLGQATHEPSVESREAELFSAELVRESLQSDVDQEFLSSRKSSKKDKKKRKSATLSLTEDFPAEPSTRESVPDDQPLDSGEYSTANDLVEAPAILAEATSEPFVESAASQDLSREADTVHETPAVEPEDEWSSSRQPSKKDKKKKKKISVLDLVESENPNEPEALATVESREADEAIETARDTPLPVDEPSSSEASKVEIGDGGTTAPDKASSMRENLSEPPKKSWFSGAYGAAKSYLTGSSPAPEPPRDIDSNVLDEKIASIQDSSASELHNEPAHQAWLASMHQSAKQFSSKLDQVVMPEVQSTDEKTLSNQEIFEEESREVMFNKSDILDEVDPDSEFLALPMKKSKKDKKKKHKSVDSGDDDSVRLALAAAAAGTAGLAIAASSETKECTAQPDVEFAQARNANEDVKTDSEPANTDYWAPVEGYTREHNTTDRGSIDDNQYGDDETPADAVFDNQETWAETEAPEAAKDEDLDPIVDDFLDESSSKEKDEDTSWMKGNKTGKKVKKGKKGFLSSVSSAVESDEPIIAASSESPSRSRALDMLAAEEESSGNTPMYDALASAPGTPAETILREPEGFSWASALKKGKKDKKKRKSVTWSDADTSTPATPAFERSDDLFPATKAEEGAREEDFTTPAEQAIATDFTFVSEPEEIPQELESEEISRVVESAEVEEVESATPSTPAGLAASDEAQDPRELLRTDLATPTTEKEDFSWAPTPSKKKSKKDNKKRGSTTDFEEQTIQADESSMNMDYSQTETAPDLGANENYPSEKPPADDDWNTPAIAKKSKKEKKKKRSASAIEFDDVPVPKKTDFEEDSTREANLEFDPNVQTLGSARDINADDSIPLEDSRKLEVSPAEYAAHLAYADKERSVIEAEARDLVEQPSETAVTVPEKAYTEAEATDPINELSENPATSFDDSTNPSEAQNDEWALPSKKSKKDKKKKRSSAMEEGFTVAGAVAAATAAMAVGQSTSNDDAEEFEGNTRDVTMSTDHENIREQTSEYMQRISAADAEPNTDDFLGPSTKKSKKNKKKKRQSIFEEEPLEEPEELTSMNDMTDFSTESAVQPEAGETSITIEPYDEAMTQSISEAPIEAEDVWASGGSKKAKKDKKKKKKSTVEEEEQPESLEAPAVAQAASVGDTAFASGNTTTFQSADVMYFSNRGQDDVADDRERALSSMNDVSHAQTEAKAEEEDLWALLGKKSKKDKKKKRQPDSAKTLDEEAAGSQTPMAVEEVYTMAEPAPSELSHARDLPSEEYKHPAHEIAEDSKANAEHMATNSTDNIEDQRDNATPLSSGFEGSAASRTVHQGSANFEEDTMRDAPTKASYDVDQLEPSRETEPATEEFWAPTSKKSNKDKKGKKRQSTLQQDDIPDVVQQDESSIEHSSRDIVMADASSETPVSQEVPARIDTGTADIRFAEPEQTQEEEWAVLGKKSKKDKKKKRKSTIAEDETFGDEPRASGTSLVPHGTDKNLQSQGIPVDFPELSARELHDAPEHQRWLAGAHAVASRFPTARSEQPIQDLEPESSARDLHNAPVHQEWLANVHNTARQYPSRPALASTSTTDIQRSREVTNEASPSQEDFGSTKKKSKKGKKDKNARQVVETFEEPISQPMENPNIVPQEPAMDVAQESDVGSDVSASTRERRRRRRSPPLRLGDDPEDLPRDRALTPPPEHDDIMDTALGIAAAMGLAGEENGTSREVREQHPVQSSDSRGQSDWSFANLDNRSQVDTTRDMRDSAIQFDSPALHESSFSAMRDSGYVASPRVATMQESVVLGERDENARRPRRPQSPTSSNEDMRRTRRSVDDVQSDQKMNTSRGLHVTPPKRQPSPVDPTSKDRSSVLFQSSPAGTTPSKTPRSDRKPRSGLQDHETTRTVDQNSAIHEHPHASHEQLHHDDGIPSTRPQSDLHRVPTIHGSQHRSREQLRQDAHSLSARRLSNELASNLLDRPVVSEINRAAFSPSPRHSTDRITSPTPRMSLHPIPEGSSPITPSRSISAATGGVANSRDDPTSGSRSLGKSKSRTNSLRDLRGSATSPLNELPPIQFPASETRAPDGATRERDMAELYDGYGSFPGSPMSPTRPPSVRKRQSMQQIRDLEAKVDQLANENRSLVEAKLIAERHLEQFSLESSRGGSGTDEALKTVNRQLQERDHEIVKLRAEIASLVATHESLKDEHEQRYSALHNEHSQTQAQWRGSTRELEGLRSKHMELSNGMDDIVRQEIDSALAIKNAEISRLQLELTAARKGIRDLQAQILERGADEFVVVRDEDYFDNACQQLCQHVQQWVLRFSKFSDTRVCRGTSEVRDEKIVDRFDNAILDGSDVDTYLSDRVKRRDIFMSVVMTMIWEYVFTRYLFGMDRDQRQKLKQLEKNLGEVGPQKAVHQWRALTLTLLSKREAFKQQCENDTEAVVLEILKTLSKFLPPPQNLEQQIHESLRKAMRAAVDLSIEMRTQKAEYIMLPPLQPEYNEHGDLARKVFFNASLMNERSGETTSNDELEASHAVVRIVLFPLVVKKGDDSGQGDEEIVVCPAQVLVARPDKGKRPKSRLASGGSLRAASTHSLAMSGVDMASPGGNMI